MKVNDPILGSLSLCRKAGKLVFGFDAVEDSVMRGKAHLVLMAADISPKTAKRVEAFCEELVPCEKISLTQAELLGVSRKPVGVYAVADENFAILCAKHLNHKEDNIE